MQMDATTVPPAGALLVRIPVSAPADLLDLPPVPAGHEVTVSVNDDWMEARIRADRGLGPGYRNVGRHPAITDDRVEALLLLQAAVVDADPSWTKQVLLRADKVYDCDLGPVQHLLGPLLAQHLA